MPCSEPHPPTPYQFTNNPPTHDPSIRPVPAWNILSYNPRSETTHTCFRPVSESKDLRRDLALYCITTPPPFRRPSCAELPCSRIRSIVLVPIRQFHLGFRSAVRGELCCFLLYSYTRDITASADDIAGGTRVEMASPTMSGLKFLFHHARHTAPPSPFSWNANTRRLLITNATPP